jgi:hypothetical protein
VGRGCGVDEYLQGLFGLGLPENERRDDSGVRTAGVVRALRRNRARELRRLTLQLCFRRPRRQRRQQQRRPRRQQHSTVVNIIAFLLFFDFRRVHRVTRLSRCAVNHGLARYRTVRTVDPSFASIRRRFPRPRVVRSMQWMCGVPWPTKTVDETRHIDVFHDVFNERLFNASCRRHTYLRTISLRHDPAWPSLRIDKKDATTEAGAVCLR